MKHPFTLPCHQQVVVNILYVCKRVVNINNGIKQIVITLEIFYFSQSDTIFYAIKQG